MFDKNNPAHVQELLRRMTEHEIVQVLDKMKAPNVVFPFKFKLESTGLQYEFIELVIPMLEWEMVSRRECQSIPIQFAKQTPEEVKTLVRGAWDRVALLTSLKSLPEVELREITLKHQPGKTPEPTAFTSEHLGITVVIDEPAWRMAREEQDRRKSCQEHTLSRGNWFKHGHVPFPIVGIEGEQMPFPTLPPVGVKSPHRVTSVERFNAFVLQLPVDELIELIEGRATANDRFGYAYHSESLRQSEGVYKEDYPALFLALRMKLGFIKEDKKE